MTAFASTAHGWARLPVGPLQEVAPSTVTGASPAALAAGAFLLTVLSGGVVVYRYGGRIDEAADASMAKPLRSVLYGLGAYAITVFLAGYAVVQLSAFGVASTLIVVISVLALVTALLSFGGLGFVVVGVWLSGAVGARDPLTGLVGVGALSAAAWFALPFVAGLLVWLGIAAVGIGGPVRLWVHAERVEMETA